MSHNKPLQDPTLLTPIRTPVGATVLALGRRRSRRSGGAIPSSPERRYTRPGLGLAHRRDFMAFAPTPGAVKDTVTWHALTLLLAALPVDVPGATINRLQLCGIAGCIAAACARPSPPASRG